MPDSSPPESGLLCVDCGSELWVETYLNVRTEGLEFITFCPVCDVSEPPEDVITPDDDPDA